MGDLSFSGDEIHPLNKDEYRRAKLKAKIWN